MHHYGKSQDAPIAIPTAYRNHSQGYTQAPLINHTSGSVHTGTSLNFLEPGGFIAPHVHSFEVGVYILEGEMILSVHDRAYRLGPGDYAAMKVGTAHAWRNAGSAQVRWLRMAAPQPKPEGKERDTFFYKDGLYSSGAAAPEFYKSDVAVADAKPISAGVAEGDLLGHFDVSEIPPMEQRQSAIAAAPGVFLKWMIDEKFGARHHRLLFIEYQPGVGIPLHDHTFEESYFILSGEVEAVMDNKRYMAKAGDVLWTSVGCVHSFTNIGKEPVRWLETFAPQPPGENVFRFMAEWDKRAAEIEG
jgi:quercetin dioxygenase-like cupin family protein